MSQAVSRRHTSPQFMALRNHIFAYAPTALIDPDTLARGFAMLCQRYGTRNFLVALEAHFEAIERAAGESAAPARRG